MHKREAKMTFKLSVRYSSKKDGMKGINVCNVVLMRAVHLCVYVCVCVYVCNHLPMSSNTSNKIS